LGAFASHCAVHDDLPRVISPLLMLAIAAGSYLLRLDKLRLAVKHTE